MKKKISLIIVLASFISTIKSQELNYSAEKINVVLTSKNGERISKSI
jgi:hypothetical protein